MEMLNSQSSGRRSGLLRKIVRSLSSIRLGITLVSLIIVYSTIGSAIPVSRQYFELTEFEYFNHSVFLALIGLFCLTLTLATVRYIPLRLKNLGVLTVHAGLLILCAGSVRYFGTKIEGDVWLDAPRIDVFSAARVAKGDLNPLAGFVAVEGRSWQANMPMIGGRYEIEVLHVQHEGMTTGASVDVRVRVGEEPARLVSLAQSGGRFANFMKINDQVVVRLTPANVTQVFYDDQVPALTVEADGKATQFELPGLPYYHERFLPEVEPILTTQGDRVASSRHHSIWMIDDWKIPTPLERASPETPRDWPLKIEIDGYLPYAMQGQTFEPGGTELKPLVHVVLGEGDAKSDQWLLATVPQQSWVETEGGASVEFRWLGEKLEVDPAWTRPIEGRQFLEVYVKDKDVRRHYDVSAGQKIDVEGTDYRLTVEELRPNWPLMTAGFEGAKTPTALVWVETPTTSFQRSVLQRYPELNQDRNREGQKILATGGLVDENIDIRYTDASRHHFLIAAGQSLSPLVIHTAPGGRRTVRKLEDATPYAAEGGPSLTLTQFIEKPRMIQKPAVVPERSRRPFSDVRRQFSMVRVHLKSKRSDWERRVWVPFNQYNMANPQVPATVVPEVPGLGAITLVYGRTERPLPSPLTLERLQTDFYPGRRQPSAWASYFRYQDPKTKEVLCGKAWLNNTFTVGDWTFFQSGASTDHEAWTILGVGNREGIMAMLAGCVMIAMGMVYAFAVKPVVVRRARRRFAESVTGPRSGGAGPRAGGGGAARRDVPQEVGAVQLLLIGVCLLGIGPMTGCREKAAPPAAAVGALEMQTKLDLDKLRSMIVQYSNRYSTIEAWAQETVSNVTGTDHPFGLDPTVAAFEFMFNAEAYVDEPVLFVKDRGLRKHITSHPVSLPKEEAHRILKTGMVSYRFLMSPAVADHLAELENDTHMNKAMGRLSDARYFFESLGDTFKVVPSPTSKPDAPWHTMKELMPNLAPEFAELAHAHGDPIPGVSEEDAKGILTAYALIGQKWPDRDADAVNGAVAKLAAKLPQMAPAGAYPSESKREVEIAYHRLNLPRWGLMFYIIGLFASIFALATGYGWARRAVLVLLLAAILPHAAAMGMRWYVLGRIPVANMYEAVVSSTLIGAVLGWLLELFLKKRVFAVATAFLGFFALILPELNIIHSNIQTMMPILDDIMLRIHTVLIISSYAVITLAFAVANCYLFVSAFQQRTPLAQGVIGAQLGLLAILVVGWTGKFDDLAASRFIGAILGAAVGGAMVVRGLCAVLQRSESQGGAVAANGIDFPVARTMMEEFDLSQRVLLYIAMVALFVGLVLGAVWADYSWGRPWGWDPKEVFALNTWLVYAVLIHARFVAKRKALWTSVLSVLGFVAMQFNWWVVNFYIVGLHSYA